jgi:hypothetical protein
LLIFTYYVYTYHKFFFTDKLITIDYLAIIIWIILLLFPLFSEIDIAGIKLKKQLETIQGEIKSGFLSTELKITQINSVISQINNAFNLNNNITNQIFNCPPTTEQEFNEKYPHNNSVTNKKYQDCDDLIKNDSITPKSLTNCTINLFKIRYIIEDILQKIFKETNTLFEFSSMNIPQLVKSLEKSGKIDKVNADMILDILSICRKSIHGRFISKEQKEFVISNYCEVIKALNKLINEKSV